MNHIRRSFRAVLLVATLLSPAGFAFALHIVPDHPGDPHFTAGPCPKIVPRDGATCPNGATTCPAFYDPALLPAGYDSVSYCATVPGGVGFQSPGFTLMTMPMTAQEQKAFLKAAHQVEHYVKDHVTVVMEPYKAAFLDSNGNNYQFFGGNEYWNPVCAADALLPPYSTQVPTIVANPDGSYSYQNLPETYTIVLEALKQKNASNKSPMQLIDALPGQQEIDVEWPATFFGWQRDANFEGNTVANFLVGTSGDYPITPGAKPFTLCDAPAAMKMLGLAPLFAQNGHTIDDINSPRQNMNVTLPGTDGAVVIPDLTSLPPVNSSSTWIYDSTRPEVVRTQLPKAYFEKSYDFYLGGSCSDPSRCRFPAGVDPGEDLIGVFLHEINHVLGVMQSQYYKVRGEETSLTYTYGTALYLLDLFDLDSDYVVDGYGHSGIHAYSDFTLAPRNNDSYEPTTVYQGSTAADLTPWVQFGSRDHVMVYDVINGLAQNFPFMNYSLGNPDGDVQVQTGYLSTPEAGRLVFVDPELVNLSALDVVHPNAQSGISPRSTIFVNTIREYSELSAQGWDVDYKTLNKNIYSTVSRVAKWYQTCFDSNGVFTTAVNSKCKFSVLANDLKGIK